MEAALRQTEISAETAHPAHRTEERTVPIRAVRFAQHAHRKKAKEENRMYAIASFF